MSAELFLLVKALHIVGAVAWFAGLFYLVRIFVYHAEALDRDPQAQRVLIPQYRLMESRVYRIICVPALVITWSFGTIMLVHYGWAWLIANTWMLVKIVLLILLSGYQHYCKSIMIRMQSDHPHLSSYQFRLLNEVPTLMLLSIVLLAVFRNLLNFGVAFIGVILFGVILVLFTKLYKKQRDKNEKAL